MENINDLVKSIKNLKIQGAQNIALKSISFLKKEIHSSKLNNEFLRNIIKKASLIEEARPTEPLLRNSLHYLLKPLKKQDLLYIQQELIKRCNFLLNFFENSEKEIIDIVSKKISSSKVIYTHCHSSTVVKSILNAHKKSKLQVHNTETRPLYQGRKTAQELAEKGIKVIHYVDSAMRLAIKEADVVLLGCDAITSEGYVINKIGSELVAETAHNYGVPVFICTNSWKFDPKTIFGFEEKIEKRFASEVWKLPPKNIKIINYAFEKINPKLITGIISEIGVFSPSIFITEMKYNYPWLFKK